MSPAITDVGLTPVILATPDSVKMKQLIDVFLEQLLIKRLFPGHSDVAG